MSTADKPNRKGNGSAPRAANLTVYMKPGELAGLRANQAQLNPNEEPDPVIDKSSVSHVTAEDSQPEELDGFGAAFEALPDEVLSVGEVFSSFDDALPIDDGLPDDLEDFGTSEGDAVLGQEPVVEGGVAELGSPEEEYPYESFVEQEPPAQMAAPTPRIIRAPVAARPVEPPIEESTHGKHEEPRPIEFREVPDPEPEVTRSSSQSLQEPDPNRQGPDYSWPSNTLVGFLVSFDQECSGDFFELRTGRLVVTCEPIAGGGSLVIDHPSVSPMHAVIRIEMGRPLQILDQLSEYGTRILRARTGREESLSGERSTLNHGDVVIFGERRYHVCLVSIEPGANG